MRQLSHTNDAALAERPAEHHTHRHKVNRQLHPCSMPSCMQASAGGGDLFMRQQALMGKKTATTVTSCNLLHYWIRIVRLFAELLTQNQLLLHDAACALHPKAACT